MIVCDWNIYEAVGWVFVDELKVGGVKVVKFIILEYEVGIAVVDERILVYMLINIVEEMDVIIVVGLGMIYDIIWFVVY